MFNLPRGINSGVGSGLFELKDFKNRTTSSTAVSASGVNVASISGISEYVGAGRNLTVSGFNIYDLDVIFKDYKNQNVEATRVSTSYPGVSGISSVTVEVPTGIVFSNNLRLTGRANTEGVISSNTFDPTPTITGISGFNASNQITSGTDISITGLNTNVLN